MLSKKKNYTSFCSSFLLSKLSIYNSMSSVKCYVEKKHLAFYASAMKSTECVLHYQVIINHNSVPYGQNALWYRHYQSYRRIPSIQPYSYNIYMLAFIEKFINLLMINGKKNLAYNIFYESLKHIKNIVDVSNYQKIHLQVLNIVSQAVDNVKPNLEVRKVRIAGMTYQVPSLISKKKQETLAIKWIIESSKKKKLKSKYTFSECLSQEIIDAFKKQGQARQKRDELHRIAEANRAYIRYRWW